MKKIIIWGIIIISAIIRFAYLPNFGFNTDETDVYTNTKLIDQNAVPCNYDQGYCNLHGLTYSYITYGFTKVLGDSEWAIRSVNLTLFIILQIFLTLYLFKKKISDNNIIIFNLLLFFSTWTFGITYFARTYMTLTFFFTLFAIFLYEFAIENYKNKLSFWQTILLLLLGILSFLAQPLGFLIYVLMFISLFFNKKLLKDTKYYILFALLIGIGYYFLKYNGLFPIVNGYMNLGKILSMNQQIVGFISQLSSKIWFLKNFTFQQFYVIEFFKNFYPLIVLFIYFFIKRSQNGSKSVLLFMFFISFTFFAFYHGTGESQKYMLYLLPLFYLGFFIYIDKKIETKLDKNIFIIFILIFFSISIPEIIQRCTMNYGAKMAGLDLSIINSVESYYPDDKTPVDYVKKNRNTGDIVITDSQLTQKYFDNKSYGFIVRENPYDSARRNPVFLLYSNGDGPRLFKNGPFYLRTVAQIESIKQLNPNKTLWIVSSYDMQGKYHHGRNIDISNRLDSNQDKVVYTGLDNNSKVFKF